MEALDNFVEINSIRNRDGVHNMYYVTEDVFKTVWHYDRVFLIERLHSLPREHYQIKMRQLTDWPNVEKPAYVLEFGSTPVDREEYYSYDEGKLLMPVILEKHRLDNYIDTLGRRRPTSTLMILKMSQLEYNIALYAPHMRFAPPACKRAFWSEIQDETPYDVNIYFCEAGTCAIYVEV